MPRPTAAAPTPQPQPGRRQPQPPQPGPQPAPRQPSPAPRQPSPAPRKPTAPPRQPPMAAPRKPPKPPPRKPPTTLASAGSGTSINRLIAAPAIIASVLVRIAPSPLSFTRKSMSRRRGAFLMWIKFQRPAPTRRSRGSKMLGDELPAFQGNLVVIL